MGTQPELYGDTQRTLLDSWRTRGIKQTLIAACVSEFGGAGCSDPLVSQWGSLGKTMSVGALKAALRGVARYLGPEACASAANDFLDGLPIIVTAKPDLEESDGAHLMNTGMRTMGRVHGWTQELFHAQADGVLSLREIRDLESFPNELEAEAARIRVALATAKERARQAEVASIGPRRVG